MGENPAPAKAPGQFRLALVLVVVGLEQDRLLLYAGLCEVLVGDVTQGFDDRNQLARLVEDRAVILFDAVGFSRLTPLQQVVQRCCRCPK